MEKKRRRRKEARPDEIIAAALEEFAEKGYGATSLGSIAARADIARSTVYLYFDDKEALIRKAFEERVGSIFDSAINLPMPPDLPFEAAFRKMLDVIYARLVQSDTLVLLRILIAEGSRFPELTKFYHENILQRADMMLGRMIATGIERGELRPEIANYDRKLIISPVIVAGIWTMTFGDIDALDLPSFIDGHVDILTKGLMSTDKPSQT